MKISLLSTLAVISWSLTYPALATVSLEFQLGGVRIPTGSIGVLVADTTGDGFTSPGTAPGTVLVKGARIGANDVIIAAFAANDLPEWGTAVGFAAHFTGIDYAALGVAEGQDLILHLFPERAAGDPIRPGEPHLTYRTEDLGEATANSTMSFLLPRDGGSHLLATIDPEREGNADLSMIDIGELPLVTGGGSLSRELGTTARHAYFFDLSTPGLLSLASNTAAGLRGEIYGPDGQLLAASGGPGGFDFNLDLAAGLHTLVVYRDAGGSAPLSYDLAFGEGAAGVIIPDVAVGNTPATLTGAGIIGGGPGQILSLLSRRASPVLSYASVKNQGELPGMLAVSGSGGSRLCSITYLGAAGNLTAAMLAGTLRTPEIALADEAFSLRVQFTPAKKRLVKKRGKRRVTLRRTFPAAIRVADTAGDALPDAASIRVFTR
jgi:hypothetical protein